MRRAIDLFMVAMGVLAVLWISPSTGAASSLAASVGVDSRWIEMATVVAKGSVVEERTVSTIDGPYRVFEFSIEDVSKGSVPERIWIASLGGKLPGGELMLVSHQPDFEVGDQVEVALQPLQTHIADAASVDRGLAFAIVGDMSGVHWLNSGPRALTHVSSQGANDYSLLGPPWPGFVPPARYWVNTTNIEMPDSTVVDAIRRAARAWESDPGSVVDLTYAGSTNATGSNSDGINSLYFVHKPSAGWLAQATWLHSGSEVSFDIAFNTAFSFSDGPRSGAFDLETVALHELGHILGLGHTGAATEVMYPIIEPRSTKGLGAGDRAGIRHRYPVSDMDCMGYSVTVDMRTGVGSPSDGADVILGTDASDIIRSLGGDDIICAGDGNDVVYGGLGDDIVSGGAGNDRLVGQGGRDFLRGFGGDDELFGGVGRDRLAGGPGRDRAFGASGDDSLRGDKGPDYLEGGTGNDRLAGQAGDDFLAGGSGRDRLVGGGGIDHLNGGADRDTCIDSSSGAKLVSCETDG